MIGGCSTGSTHHHRGEELRLLARGVLQLRAHVEPQVEGAPTPSPPHRFEVPSLPSRIRIALIRYALASLVIALAGPSLAAPRYEGTWSPSAAECRSPAGTSLITTIEGPRFEQHTRRCRIKRVNQTRATWTLNMTCEGVTTPSIARLTPVGTNKLLLEQTEASPLKSARVSLVRCPRPISPVTEGRRSGSEEEAVTGWDTTPPPAKRGDVFNVRCGPDGCTYATILDFERYESEWIVNTAEHTPGRSSSNPAQRQQFEITCHARSPVVIGEEDTPTAGSVSINFLSMNPPPAERYHYNLWYAFCRREAVKFKE